MTPTATLLLLFAAAFFAWAIVMLTITASAAVAQDSHWSTGYSFISGVVLLFSGLFITYSLTTKVGEDMVWVATVIGLVSAGISGFAKKG